MFDISKIIVGSCLLAASGFAIEMSEPMEPLKAPVAVASEKAMDLSIDVKTDSLTNTIDLGKSKDFDVAILGSEKFDVKKIDLASLKGNNMGLTQDQCSVRDVNGDSFNDLVCQLNADQLHLKENDVIFTVKGQTRDGITFEGQDLIQVIAER